MNNTNFSDLDQQVAKALNIPVQAFSTDKSAARDLFYQVIKRPDLVNKVNWPDSVSAYVRPSAGTDTGTLAERIDPMSVTRAIATGLGVQGAAAA
jgi:hypothetical protein